MDEVPRIIWQYKTSQANLVTPLARGLAERYGARSVLICVNRRSLPVPGRHDFDPSVFEEIVETDPLLRPDPSADRSALKPLAERAAEIERVYGLSLLEAIRSDRHLGRGYVVGADYPRSSYSQTIDYPKAVACSVAVSEAALELFGRFQPTLLMGAGGNLPATIFWRLARCCGIPTRDIVAARSGAALFMTENDWMQPVELDRLFHETLGSIGEGVGIKLEADWFPAPLRAQTAVKASSSQTGYLYLARRLKAVTRKWLVEQVRGRRQNYGRYLLRDQLRHVVRVWRWRRGTRHEAKILASLPEGTPFVFFPLQVEPEATLMYESPMCDNALTVIDWLAKAAPAGWLVVVKEHPAATSPRPKGFWPLISRYPNVLLAGTLEDSEEIVRRATAVATLNGSLGLQAAMIGKPVVTLHPHFVASRLDHVQVVESYRATQEALIRVRDGNLPALPYRLRQAAALREALKRCQFEVADPQLLHGVPIEAPVDSADIDTILDHLWSSLSTECDAQSPLASAQ